MATTPRPSLPECLLMNLDRDGMDSDRYGGGTVGHTVIGQWVRCHGPDTSVGVGFGWYERE